MVPKCDRPRRWRRLSVAIAAFASVLTAGAAPAESAEPSPVQGGRGGESGVAYLGSELDEVAAGLSMTGPQLAAELRRDPTLRVDNGRRLFYVDRAVTAEEASRMAATEGPSAAPYPVAQTFKLHSRPSSIRKIYLDFNGHVTRNTFWNNQYGNRPTITSAAFDADDTAGFSSLEHAIIQRVFDIVAEDYAPFNVDVTTENPGVEALRRSSSTDGAFGVRVVISNTNWHACDCGGEAYTSEFDSVRPEYDPIPAFVYTDGSKTFKFIGEASSHEAGHTLGLSHDGTATVAYYRGHGNWAPIMGVGYDRAVTQWSKGEYPNANQTQDDLAVIASEGAPTLTDDYVATASTTATLPSGTLRRGKIERTGDTDAFRFSLASTRTFRINLISGIGTGPDLNTRVIIKTSSGTTKVNKSPTTSLGANFTTTQPAGNYVVYVTGVGEGTAATGYTSYASLGNYRLTLTLQ